MPHVIEDAIHQVTSVYRHAFLLAFRYDLRPPGSIQAGTVVTSRVWGHVEMP